MFSHNGPARIERSSLHASLRDPVLRAMSFLNEAIDRFPDAISFAPGAPFPGFFDTLDVHAYMARYVRYLQEYRNLSLPQVRRQMFEYGPSCGQICGLVAEYLKLDYGIDVLSEAIVVTVGCQEGMLLVLRALRASTSDILAVINPCYVGLIGAARLVEFEIWPVEEHESGINVEEIARMCCNARAQNKQIRALYVAPDFANPSGYLMDLPTRNALLELAEREDFILIEDSTYGFTSPDESSLPSLKRLDQRNRVIFLGTFSKVCLPGARVGFVVADQIVSDDTGKSILATELASLKSMTTVNTSPISQAIIGGMLLEFNGSLKKFAREKANIYKRNLNLLLDFLDSRIESRKGVVWSRPGGGFFVRMRLPVVVDESMVELSARKFGVLWTPMAHFMLSGGSKCCELRLSCSYLAPEEIDEGTRRLAEFVRFVCTPPSSDLALLQGPDDRS